jgi:hypothetical protein
MNIDMEIRQESDGFKNWAVETAEIKFTEMNGDEWLGHAPYRKDDHPSFSMNFAKKVWFDHATQEGGGFGQLAERLGIPLPRLKTPDKKGHLASSLEETIYPYQDEQGNLLFQVVRRDVPGGKKIVQRRPDGKGSFIFDTTGVRKVLYRLPQLLKALEGGESLIFIAEGEKCVDALWEIGLPATCNPGGAGKWRDEYTEVFKGLQGFEIVILPDADRPGQSHASQVKASLQKEGLEVKIVDLGYEIRENHGEDVFDWLKRDGHTKDELLMIADKALNCENKVCPAAEIQSEGNPEDLEFPIEAMPDSLIPLIERAAQSICCPPELVAVTMLTILGAALGSGIRIQIEEGWLEKPNLFTAVICVSGSGKTPALRVAKIPIIRKQHDGQIAHDIKKAEAEKAWQSWAARKKLKNLDEDEPEPPRVSGQPPVYYSTNATTEALIAQHQRTPRGLAYCPDELKSIVTGMNQYKGGKGDDRQFWLSAWSGGEVSILRKGQKAGDGLESLSLHETCISVTGGIQPSEISSIIGREDERFKGSDGFAQRFLLSYPEYHPSLYQDSGGIPKEMVEAYCDLFNRVFNFGDQGTLDNPVILTIEPSAKKIWENGFNSLAMERSLDNLPPAIEETWAKLPAQAARLALIIHISRIVEDDLTQSNEASQKSQISRHQVDAESMSRAWALIIYFKAHIKKAYNAAVSQNVECKMKKFVEFLMKQSKQRSSARNALRARIFKDANEARQFLEDGVRRGFLKVCQEGKAVLYSPAMCVIEHMSTNKNRH